MAPDKLQLTRASEELEEAVRTADDDVAEDLSEVASAFDDLVSEDRMPDHAVLDGHLNTLRQARERADGEAADRIEQALSHAETYREDLPQS